MAYVFASLPVAPLLLSVSMAKTAGEGERGVVKIAAFDPNLPVGDQAWTSVAPDYEPVAPGSTRHLDGLGPTILTVDSGRSQTPTSLSGCQTWLRASFRKPLMRSGAATRLTCAW